MLGLKNKTANVIPKLDKSHSSMLMWCKLLESGVATHLEYGNYTKGLVYTLLRITKEQPNYSMLQEQSNYNMWPTVYQQSY